MQILDAETERLAALRRYRILDTEPERGFDDLALLASHICGTPMALITLVDEQRQWFKARVGVSIAETSRAVSFCAHAINQRGIFIVSDALSDDRFRENAHVTGRSEHPLLRRRAARHARWLRARHAVRRRSEAANAGARTGEALEALRRQVEAQLELRLNLIDLERRWPNATAPKPSRPSSSPNYGPRTTTSGA